MLPPKRRGPVHRPEQSVIAQAQNDGTIELLAPSVGLWRDGPVMGTLVRAGDIVGSLEVLGVVHDLRVPAGSHGLVTVTAASQRARTPVQYAERLLALDPNASSAAQVAATQVASTVSETGRAVFRAPSSGRFYARSAPDQPAFVAVGDIVQRGQTLALLEIMKTFHRVTYAGDDLPERARIARIVANSEDDVEAGDPLFEYEPVT